MAKLKTMSEIEKMSVEKSRAYSEMLLEMKPDFNTPESLDALFAEEMTNIPPCFEPREFSRERVWEIQKQFNLRREQAIRYFKEKAESAFSYEGIKAPIKDFAQIELRHMYDYNAIDQSADIRIAASIWILDKLWENGTFDSAVELFPDIIGNVDAYYLPSEVRHPCYSNDLINSLVHLLTHRHGEAASILCEENAYQHAASSKYYRLMELLPQDAISAAESAFKEKQWDLLCRIMKMRAYVVNKTAQSTRQLWQLMDQSKVLSKQFTDDDIDNLSKEAGDLNKISQEINLHMDEYLHMNRSELWKTLGHRELVDAFSRFTVEDPFEICFALLELTEKQDQAPWLMCSGGHLCHYAVQMLPWTVASIYKDKEGNLREESFRTYNYNGWTQREKQTEAIDYYHTYYQKTNLAQLIYHLCGCIVPVGKHPFNRERDSLIKNGLTEDVAKTIIETSEHLFLFHYQADLPRTEDLVIEEEELPYIIKEQKDVTDSEECIQSSEEQMQKAIANAKAEVEKAKREIKILKEALVTERKIAETKYSKYEQELKVLNMEHRELADLRDLVFNQENSVHIQEEKQESISFPYETRKRTVVFGGHESFLRVIRPMLPNVRFVNAGQTVFNTDLVRYADVVWVQTNCMGHSQYGNIVKATRQNQVQLRYFAFASAEKCAEQIVKEDVK